MRYGRPLTLDDALAELREGGARPLAGGTDLLVRLGREEGWPAGLVDLKALPELRELRVEGEHLRIGAGIPLADLMGAPELAPFPLLTEAMGAFAGRQIRERATLGGNLANASPAADTLPPLIAYGAVCVSDRREIPVEALATGPGETVLAEDELILALRLPPPAASVRGFFHKLASRDAMAIAVVSVAGALEFEGDRVREARLVLGAVAPTVMRAAAAEAELRGNTLTPERIRSAAAAAAAACRPIDDLRASAPYRREMVKRLLAYRLERLLAR